MNIKNTLQRHPLTFYFILAFAIAWGLILLTYGPLPKPAAEAGMGPLLGLFFAMLLGPSLAGITMTAVTAGREGLRDLFARMGRFRLGWWYLALLTFPMLVLVALWLLQAFVSPAYAPVFLPLGLIFGVLAGFFEETGWSGFAFPRLQARFGWVKAALILGVIWSLWHIVPDYLGASILRGEAWLLHFGGFVVSMIGVRFVISWVYTRTRSVLLCQLLHATSTGFLGVLVPAALTPTEDAWVYYAFAVQLAIVGAALAARNPSA